jgi:hypothetical protein
VRSRDAAPPRAITGADGPRITALARGRPPAAHGTRAALLPIMAVTSMPVRSMTSSPRRQAATPRTLSGLIGSVLELMIHAIETLRDRRTDIARG